MREENKKEGDRGINKQVTLLSKKEEIPKMVVKVVGKGWADTCVVSQETYPTRLEDAADSERRTQR